VSIASSVAAFALVAGLLTIIPGVDTTMVLRVTITRGRRSAAATAAGILSGTLIWGVAASVGAAALLTASKVGYTAVRLAGAAYLLYLGLSMLRGSLRSATPLAPAQPASRGLWRAWLRGFGVNILNPKVGVFYVAMLPQFIPPQTPHLAMGVLLALVHDVEGLAWFVTIITGAHAARRFLDRSAVQRVIERIAGAVLVVFGLRIAVRD
jgi:threonine/homoserine/homoserine lactone efflux protein